MELLSSATEVIRGVLSPTSRERAKEKADTLRQSLGEGLCICVIGAGDEAAAAAAARRVVSSLGTEASYVTLGQAGAQQSFLAECPEEKAFQLVPHWAESGLGGSDLPGGADVEECEAIGGYLGDAFVVLADAPEETLAIAGEQGAALVPVFAGTPPPQVLPVRAPWFATQEQWKLLLDQGASPDKVAAACASVLTTFGAHHKAVAEPENCDELWYADPDADRWAQLAETGAQPPPDVSKGNLRLQGSFSGKATTHSHQMDVNVGVDFEMPSKVAAKTMKQLSDSGITLPEEATEAVSPTRRSMFGSLADYFRKDGEAANQPDVTSMIMDSMQLKMDEVHATYGAQLNQLQDELAAEKAKVKQQQEQLEGLRGNKLLPKLQEECKELQAQAEKETAAKTRLATALSEAEEAMEAMAQEKAGLSTENGELRAGLARLQGEVESLAAEVRQGKDAEELERQVQSLKQQLALSEAKARDAKRRLEELEASTSELSSREEASQTRSLEVGKQLQESNEEIERLQAEGLELREMLEKITASERRLSDTVAQLSSQIETPEKKRSSEEEHAQLQKQYTALQAEYEKCLRVLDSLRGEGAADIQQLQQSSQQLRRELDQAKTSLVAETAGKAAAVAQLVQEKESVASLRKSLAEQQKLVAQIGEQSAGLAGKVQELEGQLKHAEGTKLAERDHEVTRLKSQSAGQARESEELRKQLKQAVDEHYQAHEKAKVWQQHVQDAQDKLADLTLELETLRRSREDERKAEEAQRAAAQEQPADPTEGSKARVGRVNRPFGQRQQPLQMLPEETRKEASSHVDSAFRRRDANWPSCPFCNGHARPRVLMFNDTHWVSDSEQERRFHLWKEVVVDVGRSLTVSNGRMMRVLILEIGCGGTVPTVRTTCESTAVQLKTAANVTVARINPDFPLPDRLYPPSMNLRFLSVPMGALEGLRKVNNHYMEMTTSRRPQAKRPAQEVPTSSPAAKTAARSRSPKGKVKEEKAEKKQLKKEEEEVVKEEDLDSQDEAKEEPPAKPARRGAAKAKAKAKASARQKQNNSRCGRLSPIREKQPPSTPARPHAAPRSQTKSRASTKAAQQSRNSQPVIRTLD